LTAYLFDLFEFQFFDSTLLNSEIFDFKLFNLRYRGTLYLQMSMRVDDIHGS